MRYCQRCDAERLESGEGTCLSCGHADWRDARVRRQLSRADAERLADEIRRGCQVIDNGWTYVAKRLHVLDQTEGYKLLGYETLAAWIEDTTTLRMTAGRGIRLLRVYRFFVVEQGIPEPELEDIPPSRLARVKAPVADGRITATEAIDEARVFTEHELGRHYHQTQPEHRQPRALATALKTIRDYRPPDCADARLVVAVMPESAYQHLKAEGLISERDDGLVDIQLTIPGTEAAAA